METTKTTTPAIPAPVPGAAAPAHGPWTAIKQGAELRALIEARRRQRELDLAEAKKVEAANE